MTKLGMPCMHTPGKAYGSATPLLSAAARADAHGGKWSGLRREGGDFAVGVIECAVGLGMAGLAMIESYQGAAIAVGCGSGAG